MADKPNNYTLGRGKIFFAEFAPGTTNPGPEVYLGNTPEFNIAVETEDLDHFSSDAGINELDDSVQLSVNRSGSLITDNISSENLALFFLGDSTLLTQTAQTGKTFSGTAKLGAYYQLGMTDANPAGDRSVTTLVLTKSATPLVAGVDYELDAALGRFQLLDTATVVADGDAFTGTYNTEAKTRTRVITSSNTKRGALRYVANNPKGDNIDYYMPSTTIAPNGDFALKGDDWIQLGLTVKVLKKASTIEAIYADGRPYTA